MEFRFYIKPNLRLGLKKINTDKVFDFMRCLHKSYPD